MRARLAQDLAGLAQFAVLSLQRLHPGGHARRQAGLSVLTPLVVHFLDDCDKANGGAVDTSPRRAIEAVWRQRKCRARERGRLCRGAPSNECRHWNYFDVETVSALIKRTFALGGTDSLRPSCEPYSYGHPAPSPEARGVLFHQI